MRALIAVALIAFAVCADRAAAQQVVGGALPGATLAVADVDDEGAIELTLDAPSTPTSRPAGRPPTRTTSHRCGRTRRSSSPCPAMTVPSSSPVR